jgi:hypothetical protein
MAEDPPRQTIYDLSARATAVAANENKVTANTAVFATNISSGIFLCYRTSGESHPPKIQNNTEIASLLLVR